MAGKTKSESADTTDKLAGKAHEAVDSAAEKVSDAEEKLREVAAQGQDVLTAVSNYIKENPLTALGLAFAAGTVFSSLTRRR
ncbi:MAG: DUF883 family protein [Wenzhouxiangella sp.]|nr:DUF883 family protein [Wenzhouxiangella sp.]TVR94502.1 MAG: DUF883 family protein [Wenzhouxiangellaceae bacterium]